MTAHTPGPWSVDQQIDDPAKEPGIMAGKYYVATAHLEPGFDCVPGDGTAKANACLIAAAPELLAFARMVALLRIGDVPPYEDAIALVAKATGEEAL